MSVHLVLIDALNLIRRIYAVQARPFLLNNELAENTQQQVLENTLQACRQAASKIIAITEPTHILAVFDSEQPCWRYQIYPDYKKGRQKMPEHLANKLPDIQDALMELGIDSLIPEEDEADDIIATLAVKVSLRHQQTTIISTDKCFLSMLSPEVQVYDYFNRRMLDETYVEEKFQVKPEKLIELWTLTGDNTNKIPGASGIGPVTATELLQEYGSVSAVQTAENIKPAIRKKLDQSVENIKLSRQLLALKTNIPLGFNLKDIRFQA